MELRSKCRKVKLEHGLDLVMIDYLQLMPGSGKNSDNRQLTGDFRDFQIPEGDRQGS